MSGKHYDSLSGDLARRGGAGPRRAAVTLVELLVVIAIIAVLIALMMPATRSGNELPRRRACLNNMRQIALALRNYAVARGKFPPACTVDADGKPLHSWRTLILPNLERQDLFESIDLKRPWDDPVNVKALDAVIEAYSCPSLPFQDNRTTYLAVVTTNSIMRPGGSPDAVSTKGAPANAIVIVEVDIGHAVPWMSPADADEKLLVSLLDPNTKLVHGGLFNVAFVDAHAETIQTTMDAEQLRAMISPAADAKAAGSRMN